MKSRMGPIRREINVEFVILPSSKSRNSMKPFARACFRPSRGTYESHHRPYREGISGISGGTHGTVTRTTVFEFYDSHAEACRSVAKRVIWFANLGVAMSPCDQ